jgi:hypothetical protein
VARGLYNKQVVDGVYQLDEGALLDDFFYFSQELGVGDWLGEVHRAMVPVVQHVLLCSLETLLGIESMNALPALLFSDEALMRLIGFDAYQMRHWVYQRGVAYRQGPRTREPVCADVLADNIVVLNLRDLDAWFTSVIRALAKAGVLASKVTGIADVSDLETTAHYEGCGQVTRKRKLANKHNNVHGIGVTVCGWKLIVLIDARTTPLAARGVAIQAQAMLRLMALVTQARTNLGGHARLHKVVFDKGFLDGVDLWWLQQHGILFVVPAKKNKAVAADAQAQAAAGGGITVGHRAQTVRQARAKRRGVSDWRPKWWGSPA